MRGLTSDERAELLLLASDGPDDDRRSAPCDESEIVDEIDLRLRDRGLVDVRVDVVDDGDGFEHLESEVTINELGRLALRADAADAGRDWLRSTFGLSA